MKFPEKEITLKDGRTALLRSPTGADAGEVLAYLKTVAGETPFLLRTPEEWTITEAQEADRLEAILASENDVMIDCYVDGVLAGNCCLNRMPRNRARHRASVGIALYEKFWGLGIGTVLFQELIAVAKSWGVTQLELEVIEGNDRAMGLYKKMGFTVTGEYPNASRLEDGTMLSEYIMVRSV